MTQRFFPFIPASGPAWLPHFASSVADLFRRVLPAPLKLWKAPTGGFPPASAETEGAVAFDETLGRVAVSAASAWVTLAPFDSDVAAIAALATTGILCRTGSDAWVLRSIAGTPNEIAVTNGGGVLGAPIVSLPAALTFTGKTVTGGTFSNVTIAGAATVIAAGTIDLQSVDVRDSTTDRTGNFTLNTQHPSSHQRFTSGSRTVTIPDNATQPIPVGSWIVIVNDAAGTTQTLSRAAGVVLSWGGADANRALAAPGWARLVKVGTDSWYVYGNGIS